MKYLKESKCKTFGGICWEYFILYLIITQPRSFSFSLDAVTVGPVKLTGQRSKNLFYFFFWELMSSLCRSGCLVLNTALTGLKFVAILLAQLFKCCDHRHVPASLAQSAFWPQANLINLKWRLLGLGTAFQS